jgi:ABC-type sugar transport system permease subunit
MPAMTSTAAAVTGRRQAARPGRGVFGRRSTYLWSLLFVGPNVLLFTIFIIVPILGAFALSLFEWNLIRPPEFVGLDNFIRILDDSRALNSILRTGFLIVGGVIPTVLLAFALAVLINTRFPGVKIIRTLYLMPIVISFVASAVLWQYMFEPRWGAINAVLAAVGIPGPDWLESTAWAMPAVTIVVVWLRIPVAMVLYLAALQNINPSLIEAAQLDGANMFQRMRHILWPGVRPVTLLVMVVTLRGVLFESFDVVSVMTGGGPLRSTDILINYIYEAAFDRLQLGYASALSVVLFILVMIITSFVMRGRRGDAA